MRTLVLLVTFNEAENILRLVAAILDVLPEASVVVVDDDSPDGTGALLRAMAAQEPRVEVVCRIGERGYGSATIRGLRLGIERGYDAILTLDADFSHDPADLPRLLAALADADLVIGSRYVGGVRVLNWEIRRLLLSLAANAYVRVLCGLRAQDCTSGFRAYRTSALRRVDLAGIRTNGYAFLAHLLFELGRIKTMEVPICFTERRFGSSKMSKRVVLEAIVWPVLLLIRRCVRWTTPRARPPRSPSPGL